MITAIHNKNVIKELRNVPSRSAYAGFFFIFRPHNLAKILAKNLSFFCPLFYYYNKPSSTGKKPIQNSDYLKQAYLCLVQCPEAFASGHLYQALFSKEIALLFSKEVHRNLYQSGSGRREFPKGTSSQTKTAANRLFQWTGLDTISAVLQHMIQKKFRQDTDPEFFYHTENGRIRIGCHGISTLGVVFLQISRYILVLTVQGATHAEGILQQLLNGQRRLRCLRIVRWKDRQIRICFQIHPCIGVLRLPAEENHVHKSGREPVLQAENAVLLHQFDLYMRVFLLKIPDYIRHPSICQGWETTNPHLSSFDPANQAVFLLQPLVQLQ